MKSDIKLYVEIELLCNRFSSWNMPFFLLLWCRMILRHSVPHVLRTACSEGKTW